MSGRKFLFISLLILAAFLALVGVVTGILCEACNRACAYLETVLDDLDLQGPA